MIEQTLVSQILAAVVNASSFLISSVSGLDISANPRTNLRKNPESPSLTQTQNPAQHFLDLVQTHSPFDMAWSTSVAVRNESPAEGFPGSGQTQCSLGVALSSSVAKIRRLGLIQIHHKFYIVLVFSNAIQNDYREHDLLPMEEINNFCLAKHSHLPVLGTSMAQYRAVIETRKALGEIGSFTCCENFTIFTLRLKFSATQI